MSTPTSQRQFPGKPDIDLPHSRRVGGDCDNSHLEQCQRPRSLENSSGESAGLVPFYKAGKTIGNGFGFKTPSGSVDGFDSIESAQRIADIQKEQDRAEAKTGTGPIAAVLRAYFAQAEGKEVA